MHIIKHLQLNTSALQSPTDVVEFIKKNQIDFACLQEIVYETGTESPIEKLCKENNFHYFESIHFYYRDKNLTVASAIVSKHPIKDFHVLYFNTEDYLPKLISENDFVGSELIEDENVKESMASRGLKHSIKSRSLPIVTVTVKEKDLRLICTQFTVSSWATETEKMYSMSQMIKSYLKFSKDYPTIMSGDLNIQKDSYSVGLIETELELNSGKIKNTLSENHRALEKDFPNGLAVDHVFSKGLKHVDTQAIQIDFSDHKALVSEFEIIE